MTRRNFITLKRPIFVGCEGESEVGYVALLSVLANDAGLPVHLDPKNLAPAGDPLDRVNQAQRLIALRRQKRTAYAASFILLDTDQRSENPDRTAQAIAKAAELGIRLIWQDTCHEAFLLRHLQGRAQNRPATTAAARQALLRDWPEYTKPMPRAQLARRLNLEAVRRAAAVEPDLAGLLAAIGF
ncbi:MAG: RloB domain-containing protein [Sphingomonadales bacterium]